MRAPLGSLEVTVRSAHSTADRWLKKRDAALDSAESGDRDVQGDGGIEHGYESGPVAVVGPGKGIAHTYIKPATPRLNGKVERSHRIDAEEFYRLLDGIVIDGTGILNDKLQEWEDYYNYHRPHGALGGQTPYERLKQKTQSKDQTQKQRTQIRL
jgi:transposase InsO family protein